MQSRRKARSQKTVEDVYISMEDSVTIYEASKENLNSGIAAVTSESTWLGQLFGGVRAELADLQKKFGARDAVI